LASWTCRGEIATKCSEAGVQPRHEIALALPCVRARLRALRTTAVPSCCGVNRGSTGARPHVVATRDLAMHGVGFLGFWKSRDGAWIGVTCAVGLPKAEHAIYLQISMNSVSLVAQRRLAVRTLLCGVVVVAGVLTLVELYVA